MIRESTRFGAVRWCQLRTINDFREIVYVDFEYHHRGAQQGPPVPLAACALESRSDRQFRLWDGELRRPASPWAHGRDVLFVCFNATAELSCYSELGWDWPPSVLDLNIEHRQITNGVLDKYFPRDLLSAMRHYRLSGIGIMEKEEWRDLIL